MQEFVYYAPTEIIFGKNAESQTGKEIRKSKLEFDDLKKIANALNISLEDAKKIIYDMGDCLL